LVDRLTPQKDEVSPFPSFAGSHRGEGRGEGIAWQENGKLAKVWRTLGRDLQRVEARLPKSPEAAATTSRVVC
jgi:hypothetical protein